MLKKGKVVLASLGLVSLGLCVLIALRPGGDFLRHLTARHVRETVFVSAGNRRLAGFFDGVAPDPHWDARKALQVARAVPRCGANRGGGLFARLAALVERTAHAQPPECQNLPCGGCYYQTASATCPDCSPWFYPSSGTNQCQGSQQDGSNGCAGFAPNCTNQYNSDNCDNGDHCGCSGGGGCTPDWRSCTFDEDCCSNDCFQGTCQSIQ